MNTALNKDVKQYVIKANNKGKIKKHEIVFNYDDTTVRYVVQALVYGVLSVVEPDSNKMI